MSVPGALVDVHGRSLDWTRKMVVAASGVHEQRGRSCEASERLGSFAIATVPVIGSLQYPQLEQSPINIIIAHEIRQAIAANADRNAVPASRMLFRMMFPVPPSESGLPLRNLTLWKRSCYSMTLFVLGPLESIWNNTIPKFA